MKLKIYNYLMKLLILSLIVVLFVSFTTATYNSSTALEMVYVSGLAYCSADRILNGQWGEATKKTNEFGMEVLHAKDNTLVKNGITYTIVKYPNMKTLLVAFSGTRDTDQLITEIAEAFPVDYDIHGEIKDAKVFDYFYNHYLNGFRDDFISTMKGILDTYSSYGVVFTGHSLGGAMTVHAWADFMLSGMGKNRNVLIYTFGQPRVGNPAFTDSFRPALKGWYRLVHNKDIVAHIPPCIPDIEGKCVHDGLLPFYDYHAPQEIYYDEPFENYVACSPTDGEDMKWSDSQINDSIPDHLEYFNMEVGGLQDNSSGFITLSE